MDIMRFEIKLFIWRQRYQNLDAFEFLSVLATGNVLMTSLAYKL